VSESSVAVRVRATRRLTSRRPAGGSRGSVDDSAARCNAIADAAARKECLDKLR
jgi:hypothetical protein